MGKKTGPEEEKDKARGRKESGVQRRSCQRSRKEKWRSVVERTTPWTAALEKLRVSTIAPLQRLMFLLAPPSEAAGRDVRLLIPIATLSQKLRRQIAILRKLNDFPTFQPSPQLRS